MMYIWPDRVSLLLDDEQLTAVIDALELMLARAGDDEEDGDEPAETALMKFRTIRERRRKEADRARQDEAAAAVHALESAADIINE